MSDATEKGPLEQLVDAAIVGVILTGILAVFAGLACLFVPKRADGTRSPGLVAVAMIGLIVFGCLVLSAVFSAPSHPSLAYLPQQYRDMLERKCMFVEPSQYATYRTTHTYCVALDERDLPEQWQGMHVAELGNINPDRVLSQLDIRYRTDFVDTADYYSNNPAKFRHPTMYYKNGDRPDTALLRFWETKER